MQSTGSVVEADGLSCSMHVGSSWTRESTSGPCSGRWILYRQGSPLGTDFSAASSGLGNKAPQQRARGNQGVRRGKTAHVPIAWK